MMMTVEPTELLELDVEKVSGVESPANGTRFLVLKASGDDDACDTCDGTGKIMDGNRDCPDCDGSAAKSDSAEADQMEEDLTGDAGNDDASIKAVMSSADQNDLPDSAFAYIEPGGKKDSEGKTTPRSKRHFPVHDEAHARNALARASQSPFGDKAMPKIKRAAKKFGIDVAAKAEAVTVDEARQALGFAVDTPDPVPVNKGAVQDALNGTATPEETGHEPATGHSGLVGPVTAGAQQLPEPRQGQGMHTYEIPAEDKQDLTKTFGAAFAVSSLAEAMDKIAEMRDLQERATKAGMTLAPPTHDEDATPSNMPWESYDSASLEQIAQCLAGCEIALDKLIQREQIEAMTNDAGDIADAWDLQTAQDAVNCAAGIVARLSFSEAAEAMKSADDESVEKVGRRISSKTEGVLRAARDHLTSVIGDGDENKPSGDSADSESEGIQMELTKSEFTESVIAIAQEVLKNANNGGDVSEQDVHANGMIGDDLALPGSGTDDPGVTKETVDETESDVTKQLKTLGEQVAEMGGLVAKMAAQPRRGGPILTGQLPAGIQPADEGRDGEVVKSAEDLEIEQLQKQLDTASNPNDVQHLSFEISRRRLVQAHNAGRI